jgi:hypothetical protein
MAKNLLSSVLCLCRCFLGDVDLAEGVLKQVDATCRGLMSPLLRSRQLLLWAQLYYARACCAPPAPPYDSQENSQYSWLKYLWFQGACSLWAAQP